MENQSFHIVERGRAKFAYEAVEQLMNSTNKKTEMRSYIKRLPIMIHINGLGQALAFYYSKEKEHYAIYSKISDWFKPNGNKFITINKELIYAIAEMDRSTYRIVTTEVIELLNWMKRFADGYVKRNGDST